MSIPVDKIVAYEQGELGNGEALELFAELIETGLAWQLRRGRRLPDGSV